MKTSITLRSGLVLGLLILLAPCAWSATATVTAPVLKALPPTTGTALAGQSVTISVTADGTTPFAYAWTFGGNSFAGTTATINLPSVTVANAGTYGVTVSNSAGSDTASAILTVLGKPTITIQPVALVKNVGDAATFTVAATSNVGPVGTTAVLSYQWQKAVGAGAPVSITGATSATYSIPSVALTDAGNISCVVTSTVGVAINSTTSAIVALTVNVVAPVIRNVTFTMQ